MGRKVNKSIEVAMVTVELIEQKIVTLSEVNSLFQNRYSHEQHVTDAFGVIHTALHRKLNDAYRHLMMVANLGSTEQRENVREQVHYRFLREGMEIMSMLEMYGLPPSRSRVADHDELRAEIDAAIDHAPEEERWEERHGKGKEKRIKRVAKLRRELKLRCGEDPDAEEGA